MTPFAQDLDVPRATRARVLAAVRLLGLSGDAANETAWDVASRLGEEVLFWRDADEETASTRKETKQAADKLRAALDRVVALATELGKGADPFALTPNHLGNIAASLPLDSLRECSRQLSTFEQVPAHAQHRDDAEWLRRLSRVTASLMVKHRGVADNALGAKLTAILAFGARPSPKQVEQVARYVRQASAEVAGRTGRR